MTPQAVIELIMQGATPREGDRDFLLLNPKDTMTLLESMRKEKKVERALRPDPARSEVD